MISRRDFLGQAGEIAAFGAVAGAGLSKLAGSTNPNRGGVVGRSEPPTRISRAPKFDLEITITGLCLFWSPRSGAQTIQHVLMVAPGGNVEPHYPRVFYDAVYDGQGQAGQFWRTVPLEGTELDLSSYGQAKGTTIPTIPDLLDISWITQQQGLPDIGNPTVYRPNLGCRLSLPYGDIKTDKSDGWVLQAPLGPLGPKPLVWRVVWTIKGIDTAKGLLEWKDNLKPLKTGPGAAPIEPLAPLKPKGGLIQLTISNVILEEAGHATQTAAMPPACNTQLPHFQSFRDLYGPPGPWPILVNQTSCPAGAPPQGTPYSCLPSGGH